MAEEFAGRVVDYEDLLHDLSDVDIVIASSGAPHYILTKEQMRSVAAKRRNRPMFLIDIAVPRNIEPTVNTLDGVFLYDIDDLDKVVKGNLAERNNVAQEAEEIITEEVNRLMLRLKTREVTPVIIDLQDQFEQVRAAEIEKARGKLGGLTAQQMEAIEAITRGIVNKIAHGPIMEIRRKADDPDAFRLMQTVRKLFRLGEG